MVALLVGHSFAESGSTFDMVALLVGDRFMGSGSTFTAISCILWEDCLAAAVSVGNKTPPRTENVHRNDFLLLMASLEKLIFLVLLKALLIWL